MIDVLRLKFENFWKFYIFLSLLQIDYPDIEQRRLQNSPLMDHPQHRSINIMFEDAVSIWNFNFCKRQTGNIFDCKVWLSDIFLFFRKLLYRVLSKINARLKSFLNIQKIIILGSLLVFLSVLYCLQEKNIIMYFLFDISTIYFKTFSKINLLIFNMYFLTLINW